jgi:hypothetical protein
MRVAPSAIGRSATVEPVASAALVGASVAGGSVVPAVKSTLVADGRGVDAVDAVDPADDVVLCAAAVEAGDVFAESSLAHAASAAPVTAAHTINRRSLCTAPVYESSPSGGTSVRNGGATPRCVVALLGSP